MKQALISVLVPSYNHAQYLKERIESIVNQTYNSIELIVIDDLSKDDSDSVLKNLQERYGFVYIKNDENSGTPFAAWQRIGDLAKGEYIWICESDDIAEASFLEVAVRRLTANPRAVLFYSNSLVIDGSSNIIGCTESYFTENWKSDRWCKDFMASGLDELRLHQLYGQTVPNMSSCLIKADAFRWAFRPYLKRFKLTGDWLFIGDVMRYGDVEFCPQALSRFRKHAETSRVRVQSARSQAEFILTKFYLFKKCGLKTREFAAVMQSDMIRFLYEPTSFWQVLNAALHISPIETFRCGAELLLSTVRNPFYFRKFLERYKHAKCWRKDNV